jgi:hypothetical protein
LPPLIAQEEAETPGGWLDFAMAQSANQPSVEKP